MLTNTRYINLLLACFIVVMLGFVVVARQVCDINETQQVNASSSEMIDTNY